MEISAGLNLLAEFKGLGNHFAKLSKSFSDFINSVFLDDNNLIQTQKASYSKREEKNSDIISKSKL